MEYIDRNYPLLVFIGPSGTGKSTILERLIAKNIIAFSPTWTDRPKRQGEVEDTHHFVSSHEMDSRAQQGFFITDPITLFNLPYRYALPKIERPKPGKVATFMSRIMLLDFMDSLYPNRVLYQIEAPYETVVERLNERSLEGAPMGSRLTDFQSETELGRKHADRIFVNDNTLEAVTEEIAQAIIEDYDLL